MLHAVILAGGFGTRLWPASRKAKPKHLLALETNQTLLQTTVERLAGFVPPQNVRIVTGRSLASQIAEILPIFPIEQIWTEPVPRNTAAAIGWAAAKIRQIDPDAVMIVLPADHVIKPASSFCKTLQVAVEIVTKTPEALVTLGIKPSFPATTYGYIQRGTAIEMPNQTIPAFHVDRFCEKPKQDVAERFFVSKGFYWNAGIFVWKAETILESLRRFEPEIGKELDKIAASIGALDEEIVTKKAFEMIKSISIDYAVMEHTETAVVLEATFDWNDVGTWSALDRLYADRKDENGNIAVASEILAVESSNCTVWCENPQHLIALIGLQDVAVIQTADATLIVKKDQEESVRRVVEELKKKGKNRWL